MNTMKTKKYRKKPVIIEAYQTDKVLTMHTPEGDMIASKGDYIITGVDGSSIPASRMSSKSSMSQWRIRRFIGLAQ